MTCCGGKRKRVDLKDVSNDQENNDIFIVFLDAASDGDFSALKREFEKAKIIQCEEDDPMDKRMLAENQAQKLQKNLLVFADGDGNTALHFGCKNGIKEICEYIVQEAGTHGREFLQNILDLRNGRGHTPLMEVCFKGYLQGDKEFAFETRPLITRMLLKNGADPNSSKAETRMSPLHWAAFNKDPKTCKRLLDHGANAEAMNFENQLPIDIAGHTPSLQCVDVFLQKYLEKYDVQGRGISQTRIQRVAQARNNFGKSAKHILRAASSKYGGA